MFEQRVSREVERASFAPLVLDACNRWNGKSICHLLQEVVTTPCEHQTPSLQHHRGVAQFCTELRSAETSTALCIPGCRTRDHTRARWGLVQCSSGQVIIWQLFLANIMLTGKSIKIDLGKGAKTFEANG